MAVAGTIFGVGLPVANAMLGRGDAPAVWINPDTGCAAEAGYNGGPRTFPGYVGVWGWGGGFNYDARCHFTRAQVTLEVRDPGSTGWRTADAVVNSATGPTASTTSVHAAPDVQGVCIRGATYRTHTQVFGMRNGREAQKASVRGWERTIWSCR